MLWFGAICSRGYTPGWYAIVPLGRRNVPKGHRIPAKGETLERIKGQVICHLCSDRQTSQKTLPHLHPSGSFLQGSAHSRASVASSDSVAYFDDRRARRSAPFSDRWPTTRSQPTRQARDDSPESHRLPRARTLRLHRLHRQRLGRRPSAHHLLDARKEGPATPRHPSPPGQPPHPADILLLRALTQGFDLDETDEGR